MSKRSDMTTEEARDILEEVYGYRAHIKAAADIRRGEVTLSRWVTGVTPIDTMSALFLRLILILHRKGVNWRKWMSDYEGTGEKVDMEDII